MNNDTPPRQPWQSRKTGEYPKAEEIVCMLEISEYKKKGKKTSWLVKYLAIRLLDSSVRSLPYLYTMMLWHSILVFSQPLPGGVDVCLFVTSQIDILVMLL